MLSSLSCYLRADKVEHCLHGSVRLFYCERQPVYTRIFVKKPVGESFRRPFDKVVLLRSEYPNRAFNDLRVADGVVYAVGYARSV